MQKPRSLDAVGSKTRLKLEPRAAALRLPLARLLQLLMILQSERYPNARRLSEACAVSRRTIYRDLAILEAAGIDVFYHSERQGYQLARDCWLQPTQLDDNEALALLILSRHACSLAPFGLARHARSGLAKVIQSLPGDLRMRIAISSELIPEDRLLLEIPSDRHEIHETILGALSHRTRLTLWHREDLKCPLTVTRFGIYRLARIQSRWVLVGHSSADRRIRIFEIGWIERIEPTNEPYRIPPRFQLDRFLKDRGQAAKVRHDVKLRFTPKAAPAIRDAPRAPGDRLVQGLDGTINLFLNVENLDEIVLWIVGFGDQAEVLEPAALRRAVREWAQRIAQLHVRLDGPT
jgi:proteasome accessory factor B